jgi:hypothetical protein
METVMENIRLAATALTIGLVIGLCAGWWLAIEDITDRRSKHAYKITMHAHRFWGRRI